VVNYWEGVFTFKSVLNTEVSSFWGVWNEGFHSSHLYSGNPLMWMFYIACPPQKWNARWFTWHLDSWLTDVSLIQGSVVIATNSLHGTMDSSFPGSDKRWLQLGKRTASPLIAHVIWTCAGNRVYNSTSSYGIVHFKLPFLILQVRHPPMN